MNKQGLALLELLEKSSLLEPQALSPVQCFFELAWKYAGMEPAAARLLLSKKNSTMNSISANVARASSPASCARKRKSANHTSSCTVQVTVTTDTT
jgi:hypothetical protein